jgi:hypothetical protein
MPLQEVDNLLHQKQYNQALTVLNSYLVDNPQDHFQLYRYAVLSEQIDTVENTRKAYCRCLAEIHNNPMVYLYAGYFFQQQGELEVAVTLYSLGQDLDARLTQYHQMNEFELATRKRSFEANWALRDFFTEQHQQSCQQSRRIQQAIWPQTHNQSFQYKYQEQQPHFFYVPDLKAQPIWNNKDFDWIDIINQQFSVIKSEFIEALPSLNLLAEPYLSKQYQQSSFKELAGSLKWSALHLYKNGKEQFALTQLLPKTQQLLQQLPLYGLTDIPFEVFFSILKPQQKITPHFGLSNHSLTVHLPIIPQAGFLKVSQQQSRWEEGKPIVFDDSFIHEAQNASEHDRIVLIFSVWHPELTDVDKQAIQNSFLAREQWLEQRHQLLAQLISA